MSIFIGGPLDGQAAFHGAGDTYEHTRHLGRGEIHRSGVTVHRLDPVDYTASVTDFYRRVEIEGAIHYAHQSLSLEQAKRMMEL